MGQIETLTPLAGCASIHLAGDRLIFEFQTGRVFVAGYDYLSRRDRTRLAAVASKLGFGQGRAIASHLVGIGSGPLLVKAFTDETPLKKGPKPADRQNR